MDADQHQNFRETNTKLREMRAVPVGDAPVELPYLSGLWKSRWPGVILSATLPGIVLAILGPFGSFGAPMWMRFAYWVPTMAAGTFLGMALTLAFENMPYFRTRPVIRSIALSIVMTAAMTLVAGGGALLVFGEDAIPFRWQFVFYVWLVTVLMIFVVGAIRARATAETASPMPDRFEAAAGAVQAARPATLGQRLKPGLRNAVILALEAEDHYVRVHTAQGSELILIRLADAIAEMGGVEGARTHRSWWVARAAVTESRRAEGRATLTLSNGAEAPVSRNAVAELVEKGWL